MRRDQFSYQLPDSLIARYPASERSGSRLLSLDGPSGEITHGQFKDLLGYLQPGDLMVFNNTRVIPARMFGHKESGGKLEVLVERVLDDHRVLAHVRCNKSPKPGNRIILDGGAEAEMVQRHDQLFELKMLGEESVLSVMQRIGHMPLPPYIDREDEEGDQERYQTVYAEKPGAVAAPTAGLHFDEQLLEQIREKGVDTTFVTLHVGAGTFQPVKADDIRDHKMHSELIQLTEEVCQKVRDTKARGGRVIAVGTTSVRCLETASASGEIQPYTGDTDIFIYPGKQFNTVDALVTNFHLPESTLLMLVCAFAGYHHTLEAYRQAVENEYRFFSYGDAMFVTKNPEAPTESL